MIFHILPLTFWLKTNIVATAQNTPFVRFDLAERLMFKFLYFIKMCFKKCNFPRVICIIFTDNWILQRRRTSRKCTKTVKGLVDKFAKALYLFTIYNDSPPTESPSIAIAHFRQHLHFCQKNEQHAAAAFNVRVSIILNILALHLPQ